MGTKTAIELKLLNLSEGTERDEYIEELTDRVLKTSIEPEPTAIYIQALSFAHSDLTIRSAALAIAVTTEPENEDAVDALVTAFRKYRTHQYLAPSLIEAIAFVARKSSIARMELSSLIIRLNNYDSRYLLIKVSKIINRLNPILQSSDLRKKLDDFCTNEDDAVRSEASVQKAYLELGNTLQSSTPQELRQRLSLVQVTFARAAYIEEHRPDAELFACLIEMILAFYDLPDDRDKTSLRLSELYDYLSNVLATRWMPIYRSEADEVCITHALGIAEALKRAALSVQNAEDWTNFDDALIDLAALYALISSSNQTSSGFILPSEAYLAIAENIFAPQLGSVLKKAVTRRRLMKVSEKYLATHGENEIMTGLRAFEYAVDTIDRITNENLSIPSNLQAQISQLASLFGQTPETLINGFLQENSQGSSQALFQKLGLGIVPLSIDKPQFFNGDDAVHEVSIKLLNQLQELLNPYPTSKWLRILATIKTIVSFTSFTFDTLPDYAKCQEDGGKGQQASEKDLQKDLFASLRRDFNNEAVYESAPIGGGRVDNGLIFSECRIPIEIKHEFHSISPEHIYNNYLIQADIYAAATDRVSFLLILDLRDTQAKKHVKRISPSNRLKKVEEIVSSYSWQEGFWVTSLPTDPQLPHARPHAIIIGLIQGNRPMPSSTTKYSSRS